MDDEKSRLSVDGRRAILVLVTIVLLLVLVPMLILAFSGGVSSSIGGPS